MRGRVNATRHTADNHHAALGKIVGGVLADRIGRRTVFIAGHVVLVLLYLLLLLAFVPAWLACSGCLALLGIYYAATDGVLSATAAEVLARSSGVPNRVGVGDCPLPRLVGGALAGEPGGTEEGMLERLEPFRGQRGRLVRLLEAAGVRAPSYGPRLAPRRIERD